MVNGSVWKKIWYESNNNWSMELLNAYWIMNYGSIFKDIKISKYSIFASSWCSDNCNEISQHDNGLRLDTGHRRMDKLL